MIKIKNEVIMKMEKINISVLKLTIASIFGLLLMSGCSTVGRDFTKPSDNSLVLGQSTQSQILEQLGKPHQEGISTINDQQIEEITYMYVVSSGDGVESRVVPARLLKLSFANKKLVSTLFLSSFKIDNTDFDDSKMAMIKKSETTYDEVISILGKPSGYSIAPMVVTPSVKAISYSFVMTKKKFIGNGTDSTTKTLLLEFDDKNIVTKIFATKK